MSDSDSSGKVVSEEACDVSNGQHKKSYYHCVDSRYPLCYLTLPEIYRQQANKDLGTGVVWACPPTKLSYTQLYNEGMKIAKALLYLGLRRGDVVMSIGVDGPNSLLLFIAASSLGIVFAAPYIYNPIEKNLRMFIGRLAPKLILLGNAPIGADCEDICDMALKVLEEVADDSPLPCPITICDREESGNTETSNRQVIPKTFSNLFESGRCITDNDLADSISLVGENEPCLYTCSSGSTGEPKIILIGAAMFANAGIMRQERFGSDTTCRYATTNIASEEIALLEEVSAGFYVGYDVLALPQPTSWEQETACRELLKALEQHKIEMVFAEQYLLSYIVNHQNLAEEFELSRLKTIVLGGCRTSPAFRQLMLDRWPKSIDSYGMSENYNSISCGFGDLVKRLNTCGRIGVNQEVKVVDGAGRCVPCNQVGQLYIRGYRTFLKYKDLPELTESMKTADGWLKTGDLCKMDTDGFLYILGRIAGAERFKVNSDVVYVKVIEDVMSGMPGVEDIVVIGRPTGASYGDEIIYCVKLDGKTQLTVGEVYQFAMKSLSSLNEWPIRVFFYDLLPISGARTKVSRNALIKDVAAMVEADSRAGITDESFQI